MKLIGLFTASLLGISPLFAASTATRSFNPTAYTPGSPVTVTILVSPDPSVGAYAIEETPPAGWTITNINEGGGEAGGMVKWGVFIDNQVRSLQYEATPPQNTSGSKAFSGRVSLDGTSSITIGGSTSLPGAGSAAGQDGTVAFTNVFRPLKGETLKVPAGASITSISVYDLKGNKVDDLENSGTEFIWDGKNDSGEIVASGAYLLIIKSGGASKTSKVMVLK